MVDMTTRHNEGTALGRLFVKSIVKARFAREHGGPGGASMINQHISGNRPINLEAAEAYSRGLQVPVSAFSPRLAAQIDQLRATRTEVQAMVREGDASYAEADVPTVRVPLLRNGASMGAGTEELHEDVMHGQIELATNWVQRHVRPSSPTALRFIHAYGESMAPTFSDGDVLLVDTNTRDPSIDGVFVLSANHRLYIKRVRQRMDGRYEVSSDNRNVKTADVLDGTQQLNVLGRVVWVWNGRKL